MIVTRESGLFVLRDSASGVVRLKSEDAQGVHDWAAVMLGAGTVLTWDIRP